MPGSPNEFANAWQDVISCNDVADIKRFLGSLDGPASQSLTQREIVDLRLRAFASLREFTEDDPKTGEALILEHVLPECFESSSRHEDVGWIGPYRAREILGEWLNDYVQNGNAAVRDRVLDEVIERVRSEDLAGAYWTASSIGLRRADLFELLLEKSARDSGESGDIAFSVISGLAVPSSFRSSVLSSVHERVRERINLHLVGAVRRLADKSSVDVVLSSWLFPAAKSGWRPVHSTALRMLTDAAQRHLDDIKFQNHVWESISDLASLGGSNLMSEISLGSDLGPECNSSQVVPSLLRILDGLDGDSDGEMNRRHVVYLRLHECLLPEHLRSWQEIGGSHPAGVLKKDACLDTNNTGRSQTSSSLLKESAWSVALLPGDPEPLLWIEDALLSETSPYVQADVLRLLACLRLPSIPPRIVAWVTEPFDGENDNTAQWVPRNAAIDVLRSNPDIDAFLSLVDFGLTLDGNVLQHSVDALRDVTLTLVRAGQVEVVRRVVETALRGSEDRHRRAATGVLPYLCEHLGIDVQQQLEGVLLKGDREGFDLSLMVATLGGATGFDTSKALLTLIRQWAEEEGWLGWRSLEFLARKGYLRLYDGLMVRRLGLKFRDGHWRADETTIRSEWTGFVLSDLYVEDPHRFSLAVADLVRSADWSTFAQLFGGLRSVRSLSVDSIDPAIRSALGARIRERQIVRSGEHGTLRFLGRVMPEVLVTSELEQRINDWMPESRGALADALFEADLDGPLAEQQAMSILVLLVLDAHFAVRRSALRALSRRDPTTLFQLCLNWASSPDIQTQQRGAEAIGWVIGIVDEAVSSVLRDEYLLSAEPTVREAADRSLKDLRRRQLAEGYIGRVRSTLLGSDADVLGSWAIGEALAQFGDDRTIQDLQAEVSDNLAPNKRHWLLRLIANTEQRWKKVTESWPDAWILLRGSVETRHAELHGSTSPSMAVICTWWHQAAEAPGEKHSWGGTLMSASDQISLWEAADAGKEYTVRLEDGREGRLLVSSVSNNLAVFSGQGPIPS